MGSKHRISTSTSLPSDQKVYRLKTSDFHLQLPPLWPKCLSIQNIRFPSPPPSPLTKKSTDSKHPISTSTSLPSDQKVYWLKTSNFQPNRSLLPSKWGLLFSQNYYDLVVISPLFLFIFVLQQYFWKLLCSCSSFVISISHQPTSTYAPGI